MKWCYGEGYLSAAGKHLSGLFTVAGKRRRLVLAPEERIGQPDSIARRAFKAAGVYQLGMACHAFRRGAATQLYDDMANAGHKNPLRLNMTALDHRSEQQTESYLNTDRDRRDLAMMLDQVYGGQKHEREPEQAAEQPSDCGAALPRHVAQARDGLAGSHAHPSK
ncbi:MAG TPA: hypothetical protein VMV92_20695 [Streptosporangiaceae bacterium]|nr:hypothetical protein [Streptosporangiaceae bacterium]